MGGGATLVGGVIVGGDEEKPGEIPMSCSSSTYNIHEMLANNIHESSYYKSLSTITDFNQLVDEIYNRCDHAGMYVATPQGAVASTHSLLINILVFPISLYRTLVSWYSSSSLNPLLYSNETVRLQGYL